MVFFFFIVYEIWVIYTDVRNRPRYFIEEICGRRSEEEK